MPAPSNEEQHQHHAGHSDRHAGSGAARHERALILVLCLTAAFVAVEAAGGLVSGSLALLADAGHTLTDVLGMGVAVAAIWVARRPATASRTYGLYRAEMLAALLNSILPFGIAAFILFEAWQRFRAPALQQIQSLPMLGVALLGLAVNVAGVGVLHRGAAESLNVRGAFLEALADLLGAAAVLLAALVILVTGWRPVNLLVSVGIALFILPRAWSLLANVLDVLLEGAPRGVDLPALETAMRAVAGVIEVHDLHIWTITSGFVALSAHVEVGDRSSGEALHELQVVLRERFKIEHATLQVERAGHIDDGICCTADPRCLPGGQRAGGPSVRR